MVRNFGLALGTIGGLLPWLLGLAFLLLLFIIVTQRFGIFGREIDLPTNSVLVPSDLEGRSVEAFTFTPRDGISSIDDPNFVTAAEADAENEMVPTEFVMGLSVAGETKAYPITVLSRHEIVNDTVGGVPVAVTF